MKLGYQKISQLLFKAFSVALLLVFAISCAASKQADEQSSYFGKVASEAKFTLKSFIYLPKSDKEITNDSIKGSMNVVYKFMQGRMHQVGALSSAYKYQILSVEPHDEKTVKVNYEFSDVGVFPKELTSFEFYTMIIDDNLFAASKGLCHSSKDPEGVDKGNFWYAWDPEIPGCALKEGTHFVKVKTSLERIIQTSSTYPEYEKLIVNGELKMSIVFGYADENLTSRLPGEIEYKGKKVLDPGGASFINFYSILVEKMGYKSRFWSEEEIKQIYNPEKSEDLPYLVDFTKQTPKGKITVTAYFGETNFFKRKSRGLHYFLKRALKNDSMIMYEGHSGIGRNLNLVNIESERKIKFEFNPGYQIIYLGSCLPYAYYVADFFKRKVNSADQLGTKNLDLLAYARESHFSNKEVYLMFDAVNKYMMTGVRKTYQEILGDNPKDFFGVIGDEDNPTK